MITLTGLPAMRAAMSTTIEEWSAAVVEEYTRATACLEAFSDELQNDPSNVVLEKVIPPRPEVPVLEVTIRSQLAADLLEDYED